jgi:glycosyltransferase involved in cell wall biosynthesis
MPLTWSISGAGAKLEFHFIISLWRLRALPAPTPYAGAGAEAAKAKFVSPETSRSPLVSVVIPTLGRPALLARALASVFRQTYQPIEIIVVVDGPDDATTDFLRRIEDPRLRVIVNPRSLTAAAARNIGAAQAKGAWLAFLDDDDEWLPSKLAVQMAFAADHGRVLVSCLSRLQTPTGSFIQPETVYDNTQPLDEYLFDRRSPFSGLGFVQTSSYLLPTSLFDEVRFGGDNPHDDWDFLLRLCKVFEIRIETVPEVLVVLHVDEERPSLSRSGSWSASLQWVDSIRPIVTRRAYGGFCLGVVAPRAARERSYRGSFLVLSRALRYGSLRPWRVCAVLGFWLLPEHLIRRLRRWLRPS